MTDSVILAAVGDVFLDRPDVHAWGTAGAVLSDADLVFGNCEGVYGDGIEPVPGASAATIAPTANAAGLAVFDVMSLANNHAMDGGYPGLRSTLRLLDEASVRAVGAGPDLDRAGAPVVLTRRDVRVGVVAVTSVFPYGCEAAAELPGVAPLRGVNAFLPYEYREWTPGVQPNVVAALDATDADRLEETLGAAREDCDLLVVSAHWGDYSRPYDVTDFERECAAMFVEFGVDLVIGHHHHLLRAVEVVDAVPVLYGIGHFAFDQPGIVEEYRRAGITAEVLESPGYRRRFGEYGIHPRADYPLLPFHPDARMTVIAVAEAGTDGLRRAGVVPCHIEADGTISALGRADPRRAVVVEYLQRCCAVADCPQPSDDSEEWTLGGVEVLTLHTRAEPT